MALRIVPLTQNEIPAARAFNARISRATTAPAFFLPEMVSESHVPRDAAIRATHYVALDGSEARGGCLLVDLPAWLGGSSQRVINCQSPLSEGIADRKYGYVGMSLLKFMQQQSPYVFAMGMGNEQNAWPRLLKAVGWSVRPVPFFFHVIRANRFLREMRLFRTSTLRRLLTSMGAASGLGSLGFRLLHSRGLLARLPGRSLDVEEVKTWEAWADELWEQYKTCCSFTIARDSRTSSELYPVSETRILRFLVRKYGQPAVWLTALNTAMRGDQYFGDLRVATILDCVGRTEVMPGAVALVSALLAERGADLIITNQSHRACVQAFREAGFLSVPSNYLLGVSKALAGTIARHPDGDTGVHVTRGDADGRIHL
jgi:hypothetical protein